MKVRAADLSPAGLRMRSAAISADTVTPLPGDARGIDISDVNFPSTGTATGPAWSTLKSSGVSFVSIKATEGDYYTDEPAYSDGSKFVGYQAATAAATAAGLYVMPYVFGNPHTGNGTAVCQADYAWQEISPANGSASLMLPVVLDIEGDPYASSTVNACYNQTTSGMVAWITSFVTEMKQDSGKTPIIYTNPNFWSQCTGNSTAFSSYPLWLADYGVTSPPAVAGWSQPTFWQDTDAVTVSGITGAVDGDYLTPVTQNSAVSTAVKPLQVNTLGNLNSPGQTFAATGLPPGLAISSSGLITGTPTTDGSYTVSVTSTPTTGTVSTVSFIWVISGAITFPAEGGRTSALGSPVSAQLSVSDSNSGQSGYTAPTFTATGLPTGLSISSDGVISGWPSAAGTYSVKVTAKDGLGATAVASFTWTVKADGDTGTAGAIHQNGGSNKCLDDPSSRTTSGTAIDLASCSGKSNQSWTLVEDRSIRVLGHCLAASGAHVLLYSCNGSIADQWLIGTDGSLVSVRYGTCLSGPSGAVANGYKPTLGTCTNTASKVNQHWSPPIAQIAAGASGMCLYKAGANAAIGKCGTYSAQFWNIAGNAQLAVQTSYCLTEQSTAVGAAVEVEKCANAASQHWKLVAPAGQRIAEEIVSTASGLCVTLPASGSALKLGTCSNSLSSTWRVG